mgnify:FL=1
MVWEAAYDALSAGIHADLRTHRPTSKRHN